MKIYTKKGDEGQTSLFGGQKVEKNNERIEAYGTVDELNSAVGLARSSHADKEVADTLKLLQNQLFVLGADLATPPDSKAKIERISEAEVKELERLIDTMDEQLPSLKNFILPGGTAAAGAIHLARTICRRAERRSVELYRSDEISADIPKYLNRLSDLLFVLARYENHKSGINDEAWKVQ